MIELPESFINEVANAIIAQRENYSGSATAFAKQWGMNESIYSRLKNGERKGLIKVSQWLNNGRKLGILPHKTELKFAKTEVFEQIEEEVIFCQTYSKSMMFTDEPEIGKSRSLRYLSQTRTNCFYLDGSQCKTPTLFARSLARTIGLDASGKLSEVKENVKYCLNTLMPAPIVMIDEFGDLDANTLLDLKEYWNGTENSTGWYLVAAEGAKEKIIKGLRNKKVGFRELFSRFSSKFSTVVPNEINQKHGFYKKLISDVMEKNSPSNPDKNKLINKCLIKDDDNKIGGLRRLEQILLTHVDG